MRDFHQPTRSLVLATGGMAATSHPLASRVAIDLLARGGSAADAAVGAAVLLGLCEPQMTGLGGDAFALVATPEGSIAGLNGSGRAPMGFDAEAVRAAHEVMPPADALSVTVPGAVDAFCTLHERYGRLGLDAVLQPAIDYYEAGVPVAPRVAHDWAVSGDRLSNVARSFYLKDGKVPAEGDLFAAPRQAAVLREIAAKGRAGFYEGWVADDLLAALRAAGGPHAAGDFAANRADWVEPIRGAYRDVEIVELPPNGQGAAALLMAAMLERFDMAALDPLGPERIHLEAEAAKLAYGERNARIADPEADADWRAMLTPDLAERLAGRIDRARAGTFGPGIAGAPHNDTVYLCVVDRDGMAVSLIYSIFHSFGSGIAGEKSGVLLHNRGAGFTLERGHPNAAGAGKRPMHTIIPAMLVRDGQVEMPFGVMGGQYQAAGHVRLVSNIVDHGLDPQTAIEAPRSFPESGELFLEARQAHLGGALGAMGHRVAQRATPLGGAQAIRIDRMRGVLMGASDPRKDGLALGL